MTMMMIATMVCVPVPAVLALRLPRLPSPTRSHSSCNKVRGVSLTSPLSSFPSTTFTPAAEAFSVRMFPFSISFTNTHSDTSAATVTETRSDDAWNSSSSSDTIGSTRSLMIDVSRLSVRYERTLWRKLTNSEPYREFALRNVTLLLTNQVVLLTGASSSGKSTLLHRICDSENEIVNSSPFADSTYTTGSITRAAVPVYLDQHHRPPIEHGRTTVAQVLERLCDGDSALHAMVDQCLRLTGLEGGNRDRDDSERQDQFQPSQSQQDWRHNTKPSSLSPSELYRLELVKACVLSRKGTAARSLSQNYGSNPPSTSTMTNPSRSAENRSCSDHMGMILLLDEWLDHETSSVVQTVQTALEALCEHAGACVIVVTHWPERWKCGPRHIELRAGSVVSDELE